MAKNRPTSSPLRATETPMAVTASHSLVLLTGNGALLLALLLAPVLGGSPAGVLYQSDVNWGILRLLILLAGCLSLWIRPLPANPTLIAIWLAFGWTLLSLLVNSHFLTASTLLFAQIPALLDWLCFAVVFTGCLQVWGNSKAMPQKETLASALPMAISAGATLCAIMGIIQTVGEWQAGHFDTRVSGTFFNPNFAAGLYAISLPVTIGVALNQPTRSRFLLWSGIVAILSGGLAATGSRVGVLAALTGIVVTIILSAATLRSAMPWRRFGVIAVMSMALLCLFGKPMLNRVTAGTAAHSTVASGNEQSAAFRTYTWRGTGRMIQANPLFGTGAGTFAYTYPRYALVAKTGLAHQSFLQLAAEQGIPTLLFVGLGLLVLLIRTVSWLLQFRSSTDTMPVLMAAGMGGGLVAAILRGFSDSEWSLLGDALPFFALAGCLAGIVCPSKRQGNRLRLPLALLLAPVVLFTALLLRTHAERDNALLAARSRTPDATDAVKNAANAWPSDPEAIAFAGDLERAATIEPTGKRFYQLAKSDESHGDAAGAESAYKRAMDAEPTGMQTFHAYADFLESQRRTEDALVVWRKLIQLHEGATGTVRAISELPELHPAYAYAAIAESERSLHPAVALAEYGKAAAVIEQYTESPEIYRRTEEVRSAEGGVNLAQRRRDLKTMYDKIIAAGIATAAKTGIPNDGFAPAKNADKIRMALDTMIADAQRTGAERP